MSQRKILAGIAATVGLAAVLTTVSLAASGAGTAGQPVNRDLAQVREATSRYHDVSRAANDGYASTEECVSTPDGAMGIHYVNDALFADGVVEAERPDVLLYVPDSGRMRLVAVEYVAFDSDGNTSTDDDRPSLFGQEFDGPYETGPDGPVIYSLHAWIWQANATGVFQEWNPAISCPA